MSQEITLKLLRTSYTAGRPSVRLVVAACTWVDVRRVEVQVVGVVIIDRRRRPIVAVATTNVNGGAIHVARVEKIIREMTNSLKHYSYSWRS